ncbi:ACP phosphodiesterase [Paraglaciecola sp.]|uniref:acyl carrier protein phosphodiesterase n=1 Tax=Paraglaciecola sp. TaxID=1920173 RepID=UPI003EF77C53
MNYIAHIHIAEHTQTSMLGNFLGDFVKGSDLTYLPEKIERGIRLHRSIDQYTDSHSQVCHLKQLFPNNIRRMAGVVIDIYFDYLLMQNWQKYSKQSYQQIFSAFYAELKTFSMSENRHFQQQSAHLLTYQWLHEYRHEETCFRAFSAIEQRLKGKIEFAAKAEDFLKQNREIFNHCFQQFYPELLAHGLHLVKDHHISR